MCGISCLIDNEKKLNSHTLERFTNAVAHRGPDGVGFVRFADDKSLSITYNEEFFLGFGHRRLSIIDLSEAGSQPMFSSDNKYVIVYNGEVYNYLELREELESVGVVFKSQCDTEVVLEAYRKWGTGCFNKFNGMWALAILDKEKRQVVISRDRIGVKPLYYYRKGRLFAVASEIKQFFALPDFHPKVNTRACLSYLVTGYEIPPETFFENIFAFPPACYAEIKIDSLQIFPQKYWIAENIAQKNYAPETLIAEIQNRFSSSVRLRLRSDVPVGGCLSGGLDSSAIFVEMKEQSPDNVFSAFSACFNDPAIDETPFMETIVEKTRSEHIRVIPDDEGFVNDIKPFLSQHDEPVGSISMYAQYRIMREARKKQIPVLLDGQGGDELFSGYWPSYFLMLNYCKRNRGYYTLLSHLLGALLPTGNSSLIHQALSHFQEYRKRYLKKLPFELRKEQLASFESLSSLSWHKEAQKLSPAEYRQAEIFKIHLPRLLKWEDRNSMSFSIESRVPFLDVSLVELLLSVPPELNMKNGWTKYMFRKAMNNKLPKNICWRKDKKGFETPQDKWMKKGHFHQYLLNWASKKDHAVSEYISSDFSEMRETLQSADFDSTATFRLFCLDHWLGNM